MIYKQISLVTLFALKIGDEWINHATFTMSMRYTISGDEWVTSETKWITAVIIYISERYSVSGDELQSSVKILFFLIRFTVSGYY